MQQTTTPRVLIVDDEEDLCQYLFGTYPISRLRRRA